MDFIDKKEKFADLIESYILNSEAETQLLDYAQELKSDSDFLDKDLFKNIFNEIINYLPEISKKELKQRVLMIRGFME